MKCFNRRVGFLLTLFCLFAVPSVAQYVQWVNPFIGTARCDVPSMWGNYGGTYPGAVAPWGMVQLSPETSVRPAETGYYYEDGAIRSFSCFSHLSGYPNGSAGRLHFSFLREESVGQQFRDGRPFRHSDEVASPGYYAVSFSEGDRVEMTATVHAGLFRYHSSAQRTVVAIRDGGTFTAVDRNTLHGSLLHSVIRFDKSFRSFTVRNDTAFIEFSADDTRYGLNVLLSVSENGFRQSRANAMAEVSEWDFDKVRADASAHWDRELACVDVQTSVGDDKVKFYTALYHACLLPNIVSDVDEPYVRYANFSPWDTFRTLHPMLSLLKPERQKEMVHALIADYYKGTALPKGPMSGFHIIPVLLDAAVKNAAGFSADTLYAAASDFWNSYAGNPFMKDYLANGFVKASSERSVSITTELAYNDWTLARLADMAGRKADAARHSERAYAYRNLYDTETGFMLPREGDVFYRKAGELGYQESNKWTASYFVPHNVNDLMNLQGGEEAFTARLQSAFDKGLILFDNEPVFHYPYLFTWAGRPDLTVKTVRHILASAFRNTPGGLPGNDDMGSMSSWYVLSSIGLFPACPGTDEYLLSQPLFEEVRFSLGGREVVIRNTGQTSADGLPVVCLSGKPVDRWFVTHAELAASGDLSFGASQPVTASAAFRQPYSMTAGSADFRVEVGRPVKTKFMAGSENVLPFSVRNEGESGLYVAQLKDGEDIVAEKRIRVGAGEELRDSLSFTCYRKGKHRLMFSGRSLSVIVSDSATYTMPFVCRDIVLPSLAGKGTDLKAVVSLQNVTGHYDEREVEVHLGASVSRLSARLQPGEVQQYPVAVPTDVPGFQTVRVLGKEKRVKIYGDPMEACLLDLHYRDSNGGEASDLSGFGNHASPSGNLKWGDGYVQTGQQAYLALPPSESLMEATPQVTLLTWVAPQHPEEGYVDFFTKGDYTLLKMEGPQDLAFFAGGWGRGVCQVKVPDDWYGHWHLVAGVCTGTAIRLYIDGELMQELPVQGELVATEVPWNLGRNAEMPFSRFSDMKLSRTRIWGAALTSEDIRRLYEQEAPSFGK